MVGPQNLRLKLSWRALAPDFQELPGRAEAVNVELIERVETQIRERLRELPAFAGRPFELPGQLKAFYLLAQNQLAAGPRSSREASSFRFYAVSWLLTDGLHLSDEAEGDSAPWLEIGAFNAHAWVFICCDPEDPLFGAVLPCENHTPWSRTVYERETFHDLTAFLEHLIG